MLRRNDLIGPEQNYIGYGRHAPPVLWPNGAKVAISIAVNFEAGSERSYSHGDDVSEGLLEFPSSVPKTMRDLGAESIHEYESRAGVWRMARLFEEYDVPVTYFTTAVSLETVPEVAAWIKDRADEACFHGYRWEEPWLLSAEQERYNVQAAVKVFTELVGERPYGSYWRYAPSTNSRQILLDEGFIYDSNAYNDDLPYMVDVNGSRMVVVPYSLTYNDGKFVMPSGQGYSSPSDFADYCNRAVDELWLEGAAGYGKMMSIGLHPRWMGQAGRSSALRQFIEHAKSKGDVWFARRLDIARFWLKREETSKS